MGDTRSWLIFLIGALLVAVLGVSLLTAILVGVFRLFKRRKHPNSIVIPRYNVHDDVAMRKNDNRIQAIFIAITVLLTTTIGIVVVLFNRGSNLHWTGGAFLGAFAGLVVGLIASGTLILLIRTARRNGG